MRPAYRIDMDVSRQQSAASDEAAQAPAAEKGPRARTRRLMLETATRLMQSGMTPSVSEVAEAA
ncbi:TetR/AcrR family transcriptional regulator, partial [bacterium M00.F.Ca.ET.228.01.1.1]